VERIVSYGQVTPEGEWYDQDLDQWVVVLEGETRLHYMDSEEVGLKTGDSLLLPKRRIHRVGYPFPLALAGFHADLWPVVDHCHAFLGSACGGFRA
jgi:Cupin domain.